MLLLYNTDIFRDDEDSDESDHGPSSEPTDVASPRSASSSAAPTEASTSRLNETSSDVAADEEDSPEQSDESPDSPIATGQLFTTPLNLPLARSEQSHHEEITPDGHVSTGRLFDTPSLSEDEEESSGDDQENVPPTHPRDEHVPAEAHEEANAMDSITHAREVARLTYAGQTAEAASMVTTRLRQNRYVDEDAIYDEMLRLMREKVAAERRVSAARDSFVSVYTNETDRLRSADRNEEADRIEVCFKHLQFMEPEDVGEARYLAAAERLRELERLDGAGASTSFEKYQGEDENETKETQRPKIGTGGEYPENLFFAAAIRRVLPDWVNENPSVAESLPSEMNGPGDSEMKNKLKRMFKEQLQGNERQIKKARTQL